MAATVPYVLPMQPRNLQPLLQKIAGFFPVVAVTGPRQSGKTTLCRATFAEKPYVSLEALDDRAFATNDPRDFLARYADGAVFDEVQNAPDLLSYLQGDVDQRPEPGRFILTGSQQLHLLAQVSQSLAGRVGMLQLLPLGFDELQHFPHPPKDLWTAIWQGGYPRIHDRGIPADRWLRDYVATYVERDVRQVLNVGDLQTFTAFLKLCAGRTGQELNLSALGADAGVTHNTARAWLSVLESSYLVFRVPAWHTNARKQVIRAPKLHFFDTGLACQLLGIQTPEQLVNHPLRGALFETWVATEIYKARVHRGQQANLLHHREARGLEIDLLVEQGQGLLAVEAKSGMTVAGDWFANLRKFATLHPERQISSRLVYGGDTVQDRSDVEVVPWREVAMRAW